MGKHKKHQRLEKSKVQLKKSEKTKFLPKGKNVTDTTFKIKPIVLPQQLKYKEADTPLTRKNLDIKDLITRIRHYNDNIRNTACEDMVEIIKFHHEEMVKTHLAIIIQNVTVLIQDRFQKVRKSCVKVISTLLDYASIEKIEPFFGYFSSNLRCAMTNISKAIQEDSLYLLDTLLAHVPNLVAKNSEKILPDFFSLISKLRADSQIGRTVTVNLGSKMTSVKWRIKVLSRLYNILKAIIDYSEVFEKKDMENNNIYNLKENMIGSCPLYKNSYSQVLNFSLFNVFDQKSQLPQNDQNVVLNNHIVTLIPLLYETWIEVVPEKTNNCDNTFLNEDSSAMLSCIMNIFYLLWKYIKLNDKNNSIDFGTLMLTPQGKKFMTLLITHFPYSQGQKMRQKSKNISNILKENEDPKCTSQNILICYIYSVLYLEKCEKSMKLEMGNIVHYLIKCLVSRSHINSNNIEYFTLILNSILLEKTRHWKRCNANVQLVLESAILFYNNSKSSEKCKLEIFHILSEVVNNSFLKSYDIEKYDEWLSNTASCLLDKEISLRKVMALLHITKMNNRTFQKAILKNFTSILCNLPHLKIADSDVENVQLHITYIFYYIPLQREHILDIRTFLQRNPESPYVKCLSNLLEMKGII